MWQRFRTSRKVGSEGPSISTSHAADTERPSDDPQLHFPPVSSLALQPKDPALAKLNTEPIEISGRHGQPSTDQWSTGDQMQGSRNKRDDPLGLNVLHAPQKRTVDILFIHGLGGTSLRTWCWNRDLAYLWPRLWLPKDPDFATARILSFGYNAHFSSRQEHAVLNIGDFAKDLLFRMKFGETGTDRLGQVPIIVVAHSMGGLVFKRAFIQGFMNDDFREIVSNIKSVLFLATPHNGTNLAKTLNWMLASSVFGHSSKQYVSELARRSPMIEHLNKSFRDYASKLRIFSFYETVAIGIGRISFQIVKNDSSVLEYGNEISEPLNANHHDVCKFTSTKDPNYVAVTGALRSLVASALEITETRAEEDLQHVRTFLRISGGPDGDLAVRRATRKLGTCEHFLQSRQLSEWVESQSYPVLWVHSAPGTGKSTSCTAVVDHLLDKGQMCAYFFFKHEDQQRKSLSNMLRSTAYQISLGILSYRHYLLGLARSGLQLQNLDVLTIWQQLYQSKLVRPSLDQDIYWVLDGIDESESSKQIVEFILSVRALGWPIRVLVFSRPLPTISKSFQRAQEGTQIIEMPLPRLEDDIRLVVTDEIESLTASDEFKTTTINDIVKGSQGNFLWVNLVLKRVLSCHRQEQVKNALESTPAGMDELYNRMWNTVESLDMDEDRNLARVLLSWAMYAKAPLTMEELSDSYAAEMTSVMDLEHTISHVCGQFVEIDSQNRVVLVHQSAHDYLRKSTHGSFSLSAESAHEELFRKCLVALCDENLRQKINALKFPQFLPYAAASWAFHLENCPASSDEVFNLILAFFRRPFALPWIHYLAMSGHLSELIGVSRILTEYARRRKRFESKRPSKLNGLIDVAVIETWAVDLMHLPIKFGMQLSQDPTAVYRCIPALCPTSSAMHQKFANSSAVRICLSGLTRAEWDDCLARVSLSTGRATRLAASAFYLAVVSDRPKGNITIWHTDLFEECKSINVDENVYSVTFNATGSLLACYAVSQTYVWKVDGWSQVQATKNPHQEQSLDFKFDEDDSLTMVSDFRRVYKLSTTGTSEEQHSWVQLSPLLLDEAAFPDGMVVGTPSSVSFNGSCTQIAVAYRNFPVSIWNLNPCEMVARLGRKTKTGQGAFHSHTGTNKVVWHPSGTQLLGIYGKVFKWSLLNDAYSEIGDDRGVVPRGIQCSPNGQVFLTSDVEGSVKIYNVAQMVMIYMFKSEDSIHQLCFSPSSLKFYDLRGSYCNMWQPSCLLQLAEVAAESLASPSNASDAFQLGSKDICSKSNTDTASESHTDRKSAITAIASGSTADQLLAQGNRKAVEVYNPQDNKRHLVVQTSFGIGVEHLKWNHDHSQLGYSLTNGAITVKKVDFKTLPESRLVFADVYTERKPPVECGRTKQLLFHVAGKMMFIYAEKRSRVLTLPDGEVTATRDTPSGENAQWQLHPSRPDTLVCLSTKLVVIFSWELQQVRAVSLELLFPSFENLAIDAVLANYSSRFLLVRTVAIELNRLKYSFLILPTSKIYDSDSSQTQAPVVPVNIPAAITEAAMYPVAITLDDRFVFLDRNLWVCTAKLREAQGTIVRHFFIPRDMVTGLGLRLCHMLRDGTLLCPSKGEVAIIHNDIISDW